MAEQNISRRSVHTRLLFPSFTSFDRTWIRTDIIAGIASTAVIVPAAMAYSSIAGLPPQVGLYTSLAALVLYAVLGTSPILSVSVTSTLGILTSGAIAKVAPDADPTTYAQIASTLALVTGVILIIAGLLRLGFVTNFISEPVLIGAKAGLGLWIASGQLGKVLGIPFTNTNLFNNIRQAISQIDAISLPTLGLSIITLLILFGLARFAPRIPGALVAVVFGIGAQVLFNLSTHGVVLIDPIQPGLPSLALPNLSYVGVLWPAAFAMALMSALETIATARLFAPPNVAAVKPDREWVAVGVVNIGAAFLQGYSTGGGASQTAMNVRSGARSQISQMVAALIVVLALTVLAPMFNLIPAAILGAIVLFVVTGMVKLREILFIGTIRKRDMVLALVAFSAVIFLGMLEGILVAVLLSMLTLIYQSSRPPISVLGRIPGTNDFRNRSGHADDGTFDGLLIVRPESALYFANAVYVTDHILELVQEMTPALRTVLLDGTSIPDIEYSALIELGRLARELKQRGIELWIAGLHRQPLTMLHIHLEQQEHTTEQNFFPTVEDAVHVYLTANKEHVP